MSSVSLLVQAFLVGVILWAGVRLVQSRRGSSLPLPPGPKPKPLVGNLADLPPDGALEWEHWLKHKDLYGDISSVTVMGTTMVIMHSVAITVELLEKRAVKYSDRPYMTFLMDLCGWKDFLASLCYGKRFRAYRKMVYNIIGTKTGVGHFVTLQEAETHRFLWRVLESPDGLRDHIRTEAAALILKITYGYNIEKKGYDPLVDIADRAMAQFSLGAVPGAWLVDTIPALRHLPDWMPGTSFKEKAKLWKATAVELAEKPMQFVRSQMAGKQHEPSYVSKGYREDAGSLDKNEEELLKWTAASLYTGGADTTVSTLDTFFLMMSIHPEVQKKAREEIDRVVGTDRLPALADRKTLPYVEAVVMEALRFHPVLPMSLPHVATADDVYGNYLIPKGAVMMPNIWWFLHDPSVYAQPDMFDPDRFLGSKPAPDPRNHTFGYGRRICPGKVLADSSVWLTIARALAVFDIARGRDPATGAEMEPEVRFTAGMISHPVPFRASVTPRSPQHEALIRALEQVHPWPESSAPALLRTKA